MMDGGAAIFFHVYSVQIQIIRIALLLSDFDTINKSIQRI